MPANNTPTRDTTGPDAPSTQSIVCGMIRAYMELATDQVVVYNQKWRIPSDSRLYVVVSSVGPQKPYGATCETRQTLDDKNLVEDVSVASREMIGVDLYSRSQVAIARKDEILLCLASTLAQETCELWALKMARIPMTFADASRREGTAIVNAFHLAFAVLRTRTKTRAIASYNDFQQPNLVIEP